MTITMIINRIKLACLPAEQLGAIESAVRYSDAYLYADHPDNENITKAADVLMLAWAE